jgi:hypothetical protein
MVLLLFSCLDPQGYYHECTFGGFGLEVGFEMLTALVRDGWQLESVKLLGNASPPVSLPTSVFDGQPFLEPITKLEKEWKAILTINKT